MAPSRKSREVDVLYEAPTARKLNRRARQAGQIERPKRPRSGYNIFVKQFFARRDQKKEGGKSVITQAAQRWSRMSDEQKNKYIRKSAREKTDYEAAMRRYRQEVDAQKGPSRPFVEYFNRYYQTLSPSEIGASTFVQMARQAAANWNELPQSTRDEYTAYFKQQYQLHLQGYPRVQIIPPLIEVPEPEAVMASHQGSRTTRGRSPSVANSRRRQRSKSVAMDGDDEVTVLSSGGENSHNTGAPASNSAGGTAAASEVSNEEDDEVGLDAHGMDRRRRRRRRSGTSRHR